MPRPVTWIRALSEVVDPEKLYSARELSDAIQSVVPPDTIYTFLRRKRRIDPTSISLIHGRATCLWTGQQIKDLAEKEIR